MGDRRILDETPPEFAFVVAASRWPRSSAEDLQLADLAVGLDWELVERIARRHRVEGLVWNAIQRAGVPCPASSKTVLEAAADRIGRQNILTALECGLLQNAFADAAIQILFIKGVSLAQIGYGNILLKAGWDIDILVPPDRVADAVAVLRARGYEIEIPNVADMKAVTDWHRFSKESVWKHPVRRTFVELHTALADHPMLLPGVDTSSPRQNVAVGPGITLPTLANDELFAYLCVHGASSAWFRLKWIADLAALLASFDSDGIDRLHQKAQELGSARAADIGLILCRELFGTDVSPLLMQRLRASAANRRLIAAVRHGLVGPAVDTELPNIRFGTLGIHWFQAGVMPGLRYKLLAIVVELRGLARHLPRFHKRAPR